MTAASCPQAIATDEFSEECDFVGHTDPVACAAFNPKIFRHATTAAAAAGDASKGGSHGAGSTAYTCCALGGQDAILSIWVTASPKALVVVRGVFEQDILDVAWTPDGYSLLACSMDGSIAAIRLSPGEVRARPTSLPPHALPHAPTCHHPTPPPPHAHEPSHGALRRARAHVRLAFSRNLPRSPTLSRDLPRSPAFRACIRLPSSCARTPLDLPSVCVAGRTHQRHRAPLTPHATLW